MKQIFSVYEKKKDKPSDNGRYKLPRGTRIAALSIVIFLGLFAVVTILDRWTHERHALDVSGSQAGPAYEPANGPEYHKNITQINLPNEATIFGEKIPLENWEIRERFERDFYYNYTNADQLVMWWKRSGRYFPMFQKILDEAGLPTDLKYLAIAESGLRNVKSPANANGFWQFIPGTGQRFGLRIDDQIDERLDPEKATRAAVKYFQSMKAQLPTWTLVAAGYNMGEDNVQQAMNWQHANNYWNLFINDETMRYVFRIAAIKELMTNGDKYGLDFGHLKPFRTPGVKYVSVNGPVASIADWAQQQGYLYKDVKTLNPWLVGRSIPSGSYQIALPLTDEDRTTVKQ